MQKWMIRALVPAILLVLALIVLPAFVHPTAASAILMHGSGVEAILLCTLLLAAPFGWVKFVSTRQQAAIKKGEVGRKSWYEYDITFLAMVGGGMFLSVAAYQVRDSENLSGIQSHGQRIIADVVDIYTSTCGKTGCNVEVEYKYVPLGRQGLSAAPVTGHAYLANSRDPADPQLIFAKTHNSVPVAYDITRPNISALNFNDDVFRIDHAESTREIIEWVGFIIIFATGFVWATFSVARSVTGATNARKTLRMFQVENGKLKAKLAGMQAYENRFSLARTAEQQAVLNKLQDDFYAQKAACDECQQKMRAALESMKASRWNRQR